MINIRRVGWVCSLIGIGLSVSVGHAQNTSGITGHVVTARGETPVPGVNVVVVGTLFAGVTDADGAYAIRPVPPGTYTVQVHALGFRPASQTIEVTAGTEAGVDFRLRLPHPELEDLEADARRETLYPTALLHAPRIRDLPVVATGALVRSLPGGGAARGGGLALAPSVRGLSGGQLGLFVDGVRYLPDDVDGPASVLDLFYPQLLETLAVVKGPYALTWGSGLLGTLYAETTGPPTGQRRILFETGYTGNQRAFDAAGHVAGHAGAASYRLHGAYRTGSDYKDGADQTIPAGFQSAAVQGYAGYQIASAARLAVNASYVDQYDIDLPGRLFDIDHRRMANASARYQMAWASGPLRSLDVLTYGHHTAQDVDAQPVAERVPTTKQVTWGGRLAAQLASIRGWHLEAGGTGYSLQSHADSNGTARLLPEARQASGGLFVNAIRRFRRLEISTTVRGDVFTTRLDQPTTEASPAPTHMAWSGALAVTTRLTPTWTLSAGVGSAVRPPTLYERYAMLPDVRPRPRRAVFGTSTLDPERGTQIDVWLERQHPSLDITLHAFARRIARFISLAPSDASDSSALGTLHYINGTATYWGTEATATYALFGEFATLFGQASYQWGHHETVGEPAFGVLPLTITLGGRLEAPARLFFIEGDLHLAAPQHRVAASRGDVATEGYLTANGRAGISVSRTTLLFGIRNVFDATYANALNALAPYTGLRLHEPGRHFFARLRLRL